MSTTSSQVDGRVNEMVVDCGSAQQVEQASWIKEDFEHLSENLRMLVLQTPGNLGEYKQKILSRLSLQHGHSGYRVEP